MNQNSQPALGLSSTVSEIEAKRPKSFALIVLLSGTFMMVLDFFIVNVAIPSIQRDFNASASSLQLVVVGYGLANASGLIIGGRLGDIYGRRRLFIIGLGLFTVASVLCGLAPTSDVLVAARIVQGLAGALLQPQVLAMLGVLYPGTRRAKAFAAYGLTMGLAAASGQIIGGILIYADIAGLGWRSCFLINLPVGVFALALSRRVLPKLRAQLSNQLDLPGMLLVSTALSAAIFPLVLGRDAGWPTWSVACLIAAGPLFAIFWVYQCRLSFSGRQPLVAPTLFSHKRFSIGLLVTLIFFAGNASFYFVLALYLQQGLALPPLESGLIFTLLALGFFATSMASPWFTKRLGGYVVFWGAVVLAAGHVALYAVLDSLTPDNVYVMLPILALQGCGLGMIMAPLASIVLAGVPQEHAGVASGVMATVQQIGNALGVALIGMLYYGVIDSGAGFQAVPRAFSASLVYLLGLALCVALVAGYSTRYLNRKG